MSRPGESCGPVSRQRLRSAVLGLLAIAALFAGCGSTPRVEHLRDYHIVRSGETLYTIAWRYGKDYRDLARWNDLGDGSLIFPGQLIKLYPPRGGARGTRPGTRSGETAGARPAGTGTTTAPPPQPLPEIPAEPPPAWGWPTVGPVVGEFGERPGTGTGLLIGGRRGQPVRAAAPGRVVYSGSGLIGYGQLIIVKHNDTYLSAYGHNASLLVKQGDTVEKGQRIATMGDGPDREPRLHFEIRRNGKPVDPRAYLPQRASD
ncbi:MAG TPA: peptidoglycan DD-metalloendopeptidase family protein [Woeseiaceae bacterium]|jgi:lipoprotein NlpD|nr:peptidoglycan DD-metalloendopeptidase family protein [Woeseiaceae bacterium]